MKKPKHTSRFHGPITTEFMEEVERFKLQFLCEQCALFDDEQETCAHFYPNAPHRASYFANEPIGKVLVFCRDFDLLE